MANWFPIKEANMYACKDVSGVVVPFEVVAHFESERQLYQDRNPYASLEDSLFLKKIMVASMMEGIPLPAVDFEVDPREVVAVWHLPAAPRGGWSKVQAKYARSGGIEIRKRTSHHAGASLDRADLEKVKHSSGVPFHIFASELVDAIKGRRGWQL